MPVITMLWARSCVSAVHLVRYVHVVMNRLAYEVGLLINVINHRIY